MQGAKQSVKQVAGDKASAVRDSPVSSDLVKELGLECQNDRTAVDAAYGSS